MRELDSLIKAALKKANRWEEMGVDSLKYFAGRGEAEAQYQLAWRFAGGTGVAASPTNVDSAAYWFHLAADQGHEWAQSVLGEWFYNGHGVERNIDSSLYWMTKAANKHNGLSEFQLGYLSAQLAKSSEDTARAFMWARLAALNQAEQSDMLIDTLKKYMVPEHVQRGEALALEFLTDLLHSTKSSDTTRLIRHLAEAGSGEGAYRLGRMMFFELASDTTRDSGVVLIRSAADKGFALAQLDLAERHRWGKKPLPMNEDSAAFWMKKAAEQGNPDAQMQLASMHTTGLGVKKDSKEALRLFKLAAAQNHNQALAELGYFYCSDKCPKKNKVRALGLLLAADDRPLIDVKIIALGELRRATNAKEKDEAEKLHAAFEDPAQVRSIIESWTD